MGVNDKVRGKTDIATTGELTEIGILLYPGVQLSVRVASAPAQSYQAVENSN
jgi:hypothetical protein